MLPNSVQLERYWYVVDYRYPSDLACAIFLLESDAENWIAQQEDYDEDSKNCYVVKRNRT
jgi:hypothetical protein